MRLNELEKKRALMQTLCILTVNQQVELIKNLDKESIIFLIKCLGCVLDSSSCNFKLTVKQKQLAKKLWNPYKESMQKMTKSENYSSILKQIQSNKSKQGKKYAVILAATLPLINALSERASNRKRN